MTNLFTNSLQKVIISRKWIGNGLKTDREQTENGSKKSVQMSAVWAMLWVKLVNFVMQICAESAKSAKSAKPIYATSATFASANFVGKASNESTERYGLKSRIPSCLFRYSLGSNLSRFSLVSLICLCMLTVGVGNVWGATKSFTPTNFNGQGSNSGGNISYENSPITVSSSKGYGYSTGQTRIFSGGTLVVSCTSGYTISGVALTFTSSNYQGGLSTSYTGLSTTSWTSPTLTGTARISGITVTYAANPTHTLSSAVSLAATGSVSLSATSVSEGGTATATATPNSGYRFSSWSISGTGASLSSTSSNPTTVTMGTANATVTATFVAKDCTDKGTSSITSTSGNSCDYGPVDSYYKYSTRQILYKKSELDLSSGKKGIIKSIYFKYKHTSAMSSKTSVDIYMANTDLSSLSKSSYVPYSEFTLVYSGSLNCTTTNNWNEFFLDTPFEYNGTGNLVVLIDDNSNAYDGNSYTFYYHSATGAQIFRRGDSDNQNPSTADWTTYSVQNYRPSTKFCIKEIGSCSADPTVGNVSLNGSFFWNTCFMPLRPDKCDSNSP